MKYTITELKALEQDDLIFFWNEYCDNHNYEYMIHENGKDFWEGFAAHHGVTSLVNAIYFGTFDYYDKYVINNGYNNFKTFTYAHELHQVIDFDDLVEFLNENQNNEEEE